jgi:hypothetical protein
MIIKMVVKTDPIEMKELFLASLVPNLSKTELVIKIIRIKNP